MKKPPHSIMSDHEMYSNKNLIVPVTMLKKKYLYNIFLLHLLSDLTTNKVDWE